MKFLIEVDQTLTYEVTVDAETIEDAYIAAEEVIRHAPAVAKLTGSFIEALEGGEAQP